MYLLYGQDRSRTEYTSTILSCCCLPPTAADHKHRHHPMNDDKLLDLQHREKTEEQLHDDDDDDDDDKKMKRKVEEEVVTCPSFRNFAVENSKSSNQKGYGGDSNFEFVRDHRQMDASPPSSAYPVFGYDRFENKRSPELPPVDTVTKEEDESESEWDDDHEGIGLSNTCCLGSPKRIRIPIPSPSRIDKCNSTGSSSETAARKKWRLRDLIFGRSRSDVKESQLMLYSPPSSPTLTTQKKKGKGGVERRRLTFQPHQSKELVPFFPPASRSHKK